MIPILRERLKLEHMVDENNYGFSSESKVRYKRGVQIPLKEKRIFGILTQFQLGYIPSVNICHTEDDESFVRDSYVFKTLKSKNLHSN